MRVWALSDLHLSGDGTKPMDVFGEQWRDHAERLAANWDAAIADWDVVLVAGDLSWAMRPADAAVDLTWLGERPGRKVLIKGNHDYWWPKSRTKLAALLPAGISALKKTACRIDDLGCFGARGGDFAVQSRYGDERSPADIEKALAREERELRLSSEELDHLEAEHGPARLRVCLFHYPPLPPERDDERFHRLIAAAGATICVYGHLHGTDATRARIDGTRDGVTYRCTSSDLLDFTPALVAEL